MKTQRFGLVIAALALGVAATSFAGTTEFMDDFNDGVRNKALWKVQAGTTALLREQDGKLCYVTSSTNYGFARWEWKTDYVLIDHDILDSVFTLRMPLKLALSGKSARFGVGFKDENNPGRYVGFCMIQMLATRWFGVDKSDGSISWLTPYGPKKYPATIMLRLRYNNRYKKVSFAWKKPSDTTWQAVGSAVDLNAEWGIASQRTLRPYVYGISLGALIPATWFQIDNFTVINRIPDL
jgi:hypothetical protein